MLTNIDAPMSMPPPSHQVVKFNVMNNALTCYDGAKSNSRAHFICSISKKQIIQRVKLLPSCYVKCKGFQILQLLGWLSVAISSRNVHAFVLDVTFAR